jgi:hypothetical protein
MKTVTLQIKDRVTISGNWEFMNQEEALTISGDRSAAEAIFPERILNAPIDGRVFLDYAKHAAAQKSGLTVTETGDWQLLEV